ncbi:transferrin receptor 1a isoform X2 [Hippoglossus hippoglossus]|uniref:transferrin receptor 1a isoform X2 n=1 Tax=Hippoglossus hippoglossus TaxID=8267 RepID=UPI00148CCA70|nr:transferrin receptor 1a isoform X2 [Hippoglossus hippoglossus]
MAHERGCPRGSLALLSSSSLSLPQHDQDTDTVRETAEVKTESSQGGHGPAGGAEFVEESLSMQFVGRNKDEASAPLGGSIAATEHRRRRGGGGGCGSAEEESYKYTQRVQGHRHLVKKSREREKLRGAQPRVTVHPMRRVSCEATMDQARTTISKFLNGEPHSYTRFNLTQNMEGDTSQVEMKLSSDMDEEVGGNGVGDHLNHNSPRKPHMAQKLRRSPKHLCFMAVATLLIFIIGYLIGYLVQRKKDLTPGFSATSVPYLKEVAPVPYETGAAPLMNWGNVKKLLAQKLSASNFEAAFRGFTSDSHRAGSLGDEVLRDTVIKKFTEYRMHPWTDVHFVKVQDPPASGSNRFVFNGTEERPTGFLSYSANGIAKGTVVYAHYGQEDDLKMLVNKNLDLSSKVLLVRAGKISYAEKVANAAKMNASAVLIYADPTDYSIEDNTQLFGHVHMGSGDPYTPGFPSFNHTQFPPVKSSGLPKILAQTITPAMATNILRQLGGQVAPGDWACYNKLGDETDSITVEVNNVIAEKKIHNVFGVIKGFVDADRYVVIGAQRDAWGPGFAASTVGTSVLVELARSISDMVKNDEFKPRRSIVFASFSAGEYGSVGATEWLEGYMSTLGMKACSYINLDGIVTGRSGFKVAASPLMHKLIENMLKQVAAPNKDGTLFSQFSKGDLKKNILEPLQMDNAAYPFLAFSGIPSLSFRFTSGDKDYPFFGTMLDTQENLNIATVNQVPQLAVVAAQFAGQIALRLVHDHLLQMDLNEYSDSIRLHVSQIQLKVNNIMRMKPQLLPKSLTVQWLMSAAGSFTRAMQKLGNDIKNTDLDNIEKCRILNDRIMAVERNFLSPYVSPTDRPFRHILLGSGAHTLTALSNHLNILRTDSHGADADLFCTQFALATWTIQGCAISLAGDIWALEKEI